MEIGRKSESEVLLCECIELDDLRRSCCLVASDLISLFVATFRSGGQKARVALARAVYHNAVLRAQPADAGRAVRRREPRG